MNASHGNSRILFPEFQTVYHAGLILVSGMIRGMQYHIKAGIGNGIPYLGRRIKSGKTGKAKSVTAQNGLLVNHLHICQCQKLGERAKQKIIIVSSVLLLPGIHNAHVHQIVTNGHKGYIVFFKSRCYGLRFRLINGFRGKRLRGRDSRSTGRFCNFCNFRGCGNSISVDGRDSLREQDA